MGIVSLYLSARYGEIWPQVINESIESEKQSVEVQYIRQLQNYKIYRIILKENWTYQQVTGGVCKHLDSTIFNSIIVKQGIECFVIIWWYVEIQRP